MKRVLIVSENLTDLRPGKMALEQRGCEIATVDDIEDLIDRAKKFKPQVIFVDHALPAKMGAEVIRLLKSEEDCRHIPVIYIPSQSGKQDGYMRV